MRHKVKKIRLQVDKANATALIRNLAMSVVIYEKIKTTESKAKVVVPFLDRLINIAKGEDKVTAIREVTRLIQHEDSSKKIIEVLVNKYKDRTSGYTRITKLGYRTGDNASVVQLELI
ncbi:MAG: 50S ribosomal protein L17 [Patescibacteria group bacterium]